MFKTPEVRYGPVWLRMRNASYSGSIPGCNTRQTGRPLPHHQQQQQQQVQVFKAHIHFAEVCVCVDDSEELQVLGLSCRHQRIMHVV